ncbi:hypothetical protein [Endozoicomonas numazuensis]|uniref:hypothetical protein n=1 Tax=Endozoicomonas numazuensis TaxID=1137799 RepID=UPI00068C8C9E|nr:hypothetical protein [Endozoicomonas numazuensis]
MKFLSAQTEKVWKDTIHDDSGKEALQKVKYFLSETMKCEHLVVLTGLGTSLCVKGAEDAKLAPTMADLWRAVKSSGEEDLKRVMGIVRYPEEPKDNIEVLLSLCK